MVGRSAPPALHRVLEEELNTGSAAVAPRQSHGSALALIAGNVVPLAGVLFFGWDLLVVLLVFWIDNVVVGFWTLPKILLTRQDPEGNRMTFGKRLGDLFVFMCFYGVFALFHGWFVVGIFGTVDTGRGTRRGLTPDELADRLPLEALAFAALTLLASRGVEFYLDFVRPRVFETATFQDVTGGAFGRMVLLHVVIIGGGALALHYRSPVIALALLVVLKTLGDVIVHLVRTKPS